MKRYEALIILHNPPSDDAVKAAVDHISETIARTGGTVETVQKMDRKPFARIASKNATSGYYLNLIFASPLSAIHALSGAIAGLDEVFRVLIAQAPPATPSVTATAA